MDLLTLQASSRVPHKGTTHALRREGFLPVVLYGHGVQSRPLAIRSKDFEHILVSPTGRNSLIRLEIEGEAGKEPPTVLIKDTQVDPVKGRYLHADLQQISLKEKIKAKVAVILIGEDSIVRDGAIVQHQMREAEVECLPTEIPDHLAIDLGGMGVGDSVTLRDVRVPEGVKLLGEPDEVVASILAPKQVAEPTAAEGEAVEGEAEGEGEGGEETGGDEE